MLSREDVILAYKWLLGRDPESEHVISEKLSCTSSADLANDIINSAEFKEKHPELVRHPNRWVMLEHSLGFRLWINLADMAVSWAIMNGCFENDEISFVKRHIAPGNTVLDIGANIGFFAMLSSKLVGPQGKVIGFEPLSFLYEAAVKSAHENGFAQCTIHNTAIAAERTKAQLIYAPGSTNWGGAFLSFDGKGLPEHASVTVPVCPLDDFAKDMPIDFIKIDVEGAEFLVLHGAVDILKRTRPIVMSEIHTKQLKRVSNVSSSEYISFICELGYKCYTIDKSGCCGSQLTGAEDIELANVAFIPQ